MRKWEKGRHSTISPEVGFNLAISKRLNFIFLLPRGQHSWKQRDSWLPSYVLGWELNLWNVTTVWSTTEWLAKTSLMLK